MQTAPSRKGFSAIELLVVTAILIIMAGLVYFALHNRQAAPKPTPTPSAMVSATSTPAAPPISYVSRQEEKLSFEYPPSWKAEYPSGTSGSDNLKITSPAGTQLVWSSTAPAFNASCGEHSVDVIISNVEPLKNVSGLYLVTYSESGTANHMAIVDKINGAAPVTGDTGHCGNLDPTFKSRTSTRAMWFESPNAVKEADLTAVRAIFQSISYTNS